MDIVSDGVLLKEHNGNFMKRWSWVKGKPSTKWISKIVYNGVKNVGYFIKENLNRTKISAMTTFGREASRGTVLGL